MIGRKTEILQEKVFPASRIIIAILTEICTTKNVQFGRSTTSIYNINQEEKSWFI
jgi:hypothetical protein